MKHITTSTIGYTLLSGIYKTSDLKLMSKSLLADEGKINITIDGMRLRSNLANNKTK